MVNNRLHVAIECILRENEPLAGYQIFEALTASKGSIASFYTTLFGMEQSGTIEGEWRFVDERPRKYYRLAKSGKPVPKEGFSLASILKIDQKF